MRSEECEGPADTTRILGPARLSVDAITTHIPHLLFAEHFRTKIFLFTLLSLLSNINVSIYRIFHYKTSEHVVQSTVWGREEGMDSSQIIL